MTSADSRSFVVFVTAAFAGILWSAFVGPAAERDAVQVAAPENASPTISSIVHSDVDNLVVVETAITYTIDFDRAIDASSVSAVDFDNAGTASVSIGTPVLQGDRTLQIPLTPIGPGTVRLRVIGAIVDTAGGALAVPVTDDVVRTVAVNGPAWRNAAGPGPADVALVGTAREKLVRDLYAKVLGRDAGDTEVADWVGRMNRGISQHALVDQFWLSREHRMLQAHHFFVRFLGRPAEPAEAERWATLLEKGVSEREAAVALLTSPEFTSGLATPSTYITRLYRTLLDRTPSAEEVGRWIDSGQSRPDLARSLLTSEEFGLAAIDSLYAGYLGRGPDPTSRSRFLETLVSRRRSEADIARAILASQEFVGMSR